MIEALEARLAPATFLSAHAFTFTDVDGDTVVVRSSLPIFGRTLGGIEMAPAGDGEILQRIHLTSRAAHADLGIRVTQQAPGGDGEVVVGFIDARGVDLGRIVVDGDLSRIDVGDSIPRTPAFALLKVASFGEASRALDPGQPLTFSRIFGAAGVLRIEGDLSAATIAQGQTPHDHGERIQRIEIGGSIRGGTISLIGGAREIIVGGDLIGEKGYLQGQIYFGRAVDRLVIRGDMIGIDGDYALTGSVLGGRLERFHLGGSLIGGGPSSGSIEVGSIGYATIEGDIVGGARNQRLSDVEAPGAIRTARIHSLRIGGSVIGGDGALSGGIFAYETISRVEIYGDLRGGSGTLSGQILAGGDIRTVRIHGSVIGGAGGESGSIRPGHDLVTFNGGPGGSIGQLTIDGDLRGGSGYLSGNISAARRIDFVEIAGSIIGSSGGFSGHLGASRLVYGKIGGDLVGSAGDYSGSLGGGRFWKLHVGGSLIGAAGAASAELSFQRGGVLTVGGDVVGGDDLGAGRVLISERMNQVKIGGSLFSGAGIHSGTVAVSQVGTVVIGGGLEHAHTFFPSQPGYATYLSGALAVESAEHIRIGGSVSTPGESTQPEGEPVYAIVAQSRIGRLEIAGGVHGTPEHPISIVAGHYGDSRPAAVNDAGFGAITVRGSVEFAGIHAGHFAPYDLNPDARIGRVTVHGSWTASTLTAGVAPGVDGAFGTADDVTELYFPHDTAARSRIGAVRIFGAFTGLPAAEGYRYAIEAQRIGSVQVGAWKAGLTRGLDEITVGEPPAGLLRELPV